MTQYMQAVLKMVQEEIEAIQYGTITITLNEKGKYIEIASERKQRVFKVPSENTSGMHLG